MTAKQTKRDSTTSASKNGVNSSSRSSSKPDAGAGPWDAPWQKADDAAGWETTYRGTGRAREVTSSLVLELTPEQNEWIDRTAEAGGVTPHAVLKRLIDEARATSHGAGR